MGPYLAVNSSKLSSWCDVLAPCPSLSAALGTLVLRLLLHPINVNGTPPFTGSRDVHCDRSKLDGGVRVARRRRVMDDMGSWGR